MLYHRIGIASDDAALEPGHHLTDHWNVIVDCNAGGIDRKSSLLELETALSISGKIKNCIIGNDNL